MSWPPPARSDPLSRRRRSCSRPPCTTCPTTRIACATVTRFLPISLSVRPSVRPSVRLLCSALLCVLSFSLSLSLSIYLSIYPSIYLPTYLPTYLTLSLSLLSLAPSSFSLSAATCTHTAPWRGPSSLSLSLHPLSLARARVTGADAAEGTWMHRSFRVLLAVTTIAGVTALTIVTIVTALTIVTIVTAVIGRPCSSL
jgi:hypothetical protein